MQALTPDWVVRAGVANWHDLQRGYTYDRRGQVYGFSVQYAPGVAWQDLARAGQFQHAQVCYADRKDLERAVAALGYALVLVATPGRGYHHELTLSLAHGGVMLTSLPDDAAQALSRIFQQHRVPRP